MTESPDNRRLDSWKEIAAYLSRDVSTVIRWEKDKDLPIHRIPGGKRQGVFAYSQEIRDWMLGQSEQESRDSNSRNSETSAPSPLSSGPPPLRPIPARGPGATPLRVTLGIAAGIALLAGGAFLSLGRLGSAANRLPPLERPLRFARADYEASAPRGMVVGDFNGDGKLDLAFTDSLHGSVVVLLGDGHGGFPQRVTSPTILNSPEHIAVGDFNGDGRLDVVLTSCFGGRDVEVLLGNGDGSFRQHVRYDVGGRSRWVSVGDVNGDGKPDLVVAASVAGQIIVKFGNGDGTFLDAGRYEAERDVAALALADLNGDGKLDIIASDYRHATGSSVSVYLNNGDGTFAARQTFPAGSGPLGLAVADLNGDGRPDVVTANFPLGGFILKGIGGARFAEPVAFDAGQGNGYVAVADMDRDGVPDLIVLGEHSASASILMGNGRGGFLPAQQIPTGAYPDGVVVADFDGDGKLDMAILNINGDSISVFLNRTEIASFRNWLAHPGSSRTN